MDKAKHYRSRADDVRRIAEGIYDPLERSKIIAIADDYESLALEADAAADVEENPDRNSRAAEKQTATW
jgi:hypothetical protein